MLERKGKVIIKDSFTEGGRKINYEIIQDGQKIEDAIIVFEKFEDFLEKKEEILKKEKEIIIKTSKGMIKYFIINNKEEFNNKIKKFELNIDIKKEGLMLNYKIRTFGLIIPRIFNVIFLEKINLKKDTIKILTFENCYFVKEVEGNFLKKEILSFKMCEFNKELDLSASNIESLTFLKCNFKENLFINCSTIDILDIKEINAEIFGLSASKIKNFATIMDINILKKFDLSASEIYNKLTLYMKKDGNSCINFRDLKCKYFEIEYKGSNKIMFNNIFIEKKSKINIKELSNRNYKIFEIFDGKELNLEKTLENIKSLLWIPEIKENTEMYLDLIYLQKRYEKKLLIEEKGNFLKKIENILNWSGNEFLEITTKYFTCWKRCLLSILSINGIFTILYFFNSKNIIVNAGLASNTDNNVSSLFEIYKNSFRLLKECLYFSLISFSTVGYGDISPINDLKLLAAFEGLLGIFFTSAFVICLTRKYVK